MKTGRNQPCPCGSGKKFKRCHGVARPLVSPYIPNTAGFDAVLRKAKAQAFQRARQQGHGRPIMSAVLGPTRLVAVGKKIAYGKWKVFPDFLLHHLRSTLGADWVNAEFAKAESDQHPIMAWFRALAAIHAKHQTAEGEIFQTPYYGACGAVTSLAYDLYMIEHHANDPQAERSFALILDRLRKPDQFFGARHECRAAGILLRAGFELTWEDEVSQRTRRHGEFTATFPETGRAFWVECRMRQPAVQGAGFKFTGLISDALQKPTSLERLLFIELNDATRRLNVVTGGWAYAAVTQLRKLEEQPTASSLPSAEVIISNFPEHHHLEEVVPSVEMVMESFKTDRYRMGRMEDLRDAVQVRSENPELEALWRSIQEHHSIPITFDGSLPGVDESTRLIIGRRYELPSGEVGVLEEATVVEQWKRAAGILRLTDGSQVITQFDLSDHELTAWRLHPETFFGELRPHHPPVTSPMDFYNFFATCYATTPKNKLLELMKKHEDIEQLKTKSQDELVKIYAYRMTASVSKDSPQVQPEWQRRLRRSFKQDQSSDIAVESGLSENAKSSAENK